MDVARCPVCEQLLPVWGPGGVMVHLLAAHADSAEALWVFQQLALQPVPLAQVWHSGPPPA